MTHACLSPILFSPKQKKFRDLYISSLIIIFYYDMILFICLEVEEYTGGKKTMIIIFFSKLYLGAH